MKFLQTSDWHIGVGFAHLSEKASQLRAYRLQAASSIVAMAAKFQALIIAGNCLANNQVRESEVVELAEILRRARVPIYLLPGATDPYSLDSPYRDRDLFAHPVHILETNTPLELEACILCPAPWRLEGHPPAAPKQAQDTDKPTVAVACCPPENYQPWSNFSHVALGGMTRTHLIGNAHWSGTPEPLNYGDTVGKVLQVSLGSSTVSNKSVGVTRWKEVHLSVKDLPSIESKLNLDNPAETVVKLRLEGSITESAALDLKATLAGLRPRFLHLEVLDQTHLYDDLTEDCYDNRLLTLMRQHLLRKTETKEARVKLRRLICASGQEELR